MCEDTEEIKTFFFVCSSCIVLDEQEHSHRVETQISTGSRHDSRNLVAEPQKPPEIDLLQEEPALGLRSTPPWVPWPL